MLAGQLQAAAEQRGWTPNRKTTTNGPRRGDEIFDGTDYPRTWSEFIGQKKAIVRLKAACSAAFLYDEPLRHVLLASGLHGVGKTSLAKLIAANLGAGLIEVSGKISVNEIRPILRGMQDGDVLFIDEIHQLVAGGKVNGEWLLHLLQDGVLMTAKGPEEMPRITVVAATTDVQKLPETIISRFPITPVIEAYTAEEAAEIARGMAVKVGFGELIPVPSQETLLAVAKAANNSPRDIKSILITLRDAAVTGAAFPDEDGTYDMTTPLEWLELTADGLDKLAQEYLCYLHLSDTGKLSLDDLTKKLQTTALGHTEQLLKQRDYVITTGKGRELTDAGRERADALLDEKMPKAA